MDEMKIDKIISDNVKDYPRLNERQKLFCLLLSCKCKNEPLCETYVIDKKTEEKNVLIK